MLERPDAASPAPRYRFRSFRPALAWAAALVGRGRRRPWTARGRLVDACNLRSEPDRSPWPVTIPPAVGGVPSTSTTRSRSSSSHVPAGVGTPRNGAVRALARAAWQSSVRRRCRSCHGASGLKTTVDASAGRYVVGGKLAASLKLSGSRGTVTDDFGVQAAGRPSSPSVVSSASCCC